MKIYADILFIVNLYVDYFILLYVKKFLHLRTKTSRLLLGALTGASFSLCSLIQIPDIINYILALIFGFVISFITFYCKDYKIILKSYISFLSISFAFSGIILLLSQFTTSAIVINGKPYFQISPWLLFLFTVLSYLVSELFSRIQGHSANSFNFCKVVIEENGQEFELFAKIDTGNSLKEPFSGLPVMVAEKSEFINFADKKDVFRLVPFTSLGGNGLLPAYKPEKIYIKKSKKPLDCYLAIYDGKLSTGSYNCLMSPELI